MNPEEIDLIEQNATRRLLGREYKPWQVKIMKEWMDTTVSQEDIDEVERISLREQLKKEQG